MADIELEGWPEPARVVISTMSRRSRRAIPLSSPIEREPLAAPLLPRPWPARWASETVAATEDLLSYGAGMARTSSRRRNAGCGRRSLAVSGSITRCQVAQDVLLHLARQESVRAQTDVRVTPRVRQPAPLFVQLGRLQSHLSTATHGARRGAEIDQKIRDAAVLPEILHVRVLLSDGVSLDAAHAEPPRELAFPGPAHANDGNAHVQERPQTRRRSQGVCGKMARNKLTERTSAGTLPPADRHLGTIPNRFTWVTAHQE